MLTKVYNMAGEQVGEIELSEAVFGITPNESVVHDVVKNHLANCRQGTQSALTRAEVSGGGRKPWRQKGTGDRKSVAQGKSVELGGRRSIKKKSSAIRLSIIVPAYFPDREVTIEC